MLTGAGDYVGLTNMRHAGGGFWQPLTQTGVIYLGEPPGMVKSVE